MLDNSLYKAKPHPNEPVKYTEQELLKGNEWCQTYDGPAHFAHIKHVHYAK
jgi:hypothetical protein